MDPLLAALPGETGDFDFGAFLREDTADMDLDAAVVASRSSAPSHSPTDSSNAGPSSDVVRASSGGKRHERRGHTKSRRGCFNCKRRRIKVWPCYHTLPSRPCVSQRR